MGAKKPEGNQNITRGHLPGGEISTPNNHNLKLQPIASERKRAERLISPRPEIYQPPKL